MKLKTLFVNFLIFAGALLILEIGLRVAQPSHGFFKRNFAEEVSSNTQSINQTESWMKADIDLGWVSDEKNISRLSLGITSATDYQIDKYGFRNTLDLEDSSTYEKKIMLIGDSFMFGLHLSEHQTITNKLQKGSNPNYAFYNVSSPGWGIDQMYLAYKKYVEVIDPDVVVIMYIDNDILRNLHSRRGNGIKPRFSIENNQLVPDLSSPGLLEKFCWTNQISNRLYTRYMENYAIKLSKKLFEEIIRSENEANRIPLFVHIGSEKQVLTKDQVFLHQEEFIENDRARYLELLDTLKYMDEAALKEMYLPNDSHFSEKGATLVAELIMRELDSRPNLIVKP